MQLLALHRNVGAAEKDYEGRAHMFSGGVVNTSVAEYGPRDSDRLNIIALVVVQSVEQSVAYPALRYLVNFGVFLQFDLEV